MYGQNQVPSPQITGATVDETLFLAALEAESIKVDPVCSSKRNLAVRASEPTGTAFGTCVVPPTQAAIRSRACSRRSASWRSRSERFARICSYPSRFSNFGSRRNGGQSLRSSFEGLSVKLLKKAVRR